jgi:hypothetical protein
LAGNSFFILFIIESGTLYVKEILIKKMQGVGDPWFPFTAICRLISIDRPLPLSYIHRERSTKHQRFGQCVTFLFHQTGRWICDCAAEKPERQPGKEVQ